MGHTLSSTCLFSHSFSVALPIDSLTDTWKLEKCRLLQSYQTSQDDLIRVVQPQVRLGRAWKADIELHEAERDLVREAVRGMVQLQGRAGIGCGEWKTPSEKMSERENRSRGRYFRGLRRTSGRGERLRWVRWRCSLDGESGGIW